MEKRKSWRLLQRTTDNLAFALDRLWPGARDRFAPIYLEISEAVEAARTTNWPDKKYNELIVALKELREAEAALAVCKRRVDELSGVNGSASQYKDRKRTLSAKEFRAAARYERRPTSRRTLDRSL